MKIICGQCGLSFFYDDRLGLNVRPVPYRAGRPSFIETIMPWCPHCDAINSRLQVDPRATRIVWGKSHERKQ